MSDVHKPVLLGEVINALAIKKNGVYLDLTFGRGGHSREILNSLGPEGRLIAVDRDPTAIDVGKTGPFLNRSNFSIVHAAFSELSSIVEKEGLVGKVDGILLDLGVSSPQLDNPNRGFSFTREGPLDMRMNPDQGMDAATWLNQASTDELSRVLREYGGERFSRKIALAIEAEKERGAITTTTQLAKIIEKAVLTREKHKHPATRSFQAIRIVINRELEEIRTCLQATINVLAKGGRLCVISFHSLEDRIVKRFMREHAKGRDIPIEIPVIHEDIQRELKLVGKLILPTEEEILENIRSRSARLRVAERI